MKKTKFIAGKNKKRKKRRLRKPIRIFLWGIGIASAALLSNGIYKAAASNGFSGDGLNLIVKAFNGSADTEKETSAIGFMADWEIDQEESSLQDEDKNLDLAQKDDPTDDQQNESSQNDNSSSTAPDEEEASSQSGESVTADSQSSKEDTANSASSAAGEKVLASSASDTDNESAAVEEPIATILVDAGHGGVDAGMTLSDENGNPVWMEKDLNLQAAFEFRDAMAKINPRIKVEMVRETDTATTDENPAVYSEAAELTRRMDILKEKNADYYLSLHCNSGAESESGVLLFIKPDDPFSAKLSENVFNAFDALGWSQSQSVITTDVYPLHVVTLSPVPSMLVEMGYMTNPDDLAKLVDPAQRTKLMEQLAAAYSELILEEKNQPAAA